MWRSRRFALVFLLVSSCGRSPSSGNDGVPESDAGTDGGGGGTAAGTGGAAGSKPHVTVYFRSDNVSTDGLWYKRGGVREVAAP